MNCKNIAVVIGVLLAAVSIVMAVWMAVAGPVTVARILRYGDTDIDDYSHYPSRELRPSDSPFTFDHAAEQAKLFDEVLQAQGLGPDLESLLAASDSIAFLVIRDDEVLYERDFQGHKPDSLSQLFSVTKSFTSALVGMAIQDGYLAGVDQPVTDFIPELAGEGFSNVTIHHLLTMMSGSSYQENDNPFGEHVILNYTPGLEERILSFDMEAPPGTVFRYKSGDNALLGLILSRALAPESIAAYTQRRLWSPIGMQDRGVWTVDHAGDGLEKTWCCLAASARDLAKFGRLYLNRGAWGGERILPAAWVETSTQVSHVPEGEWPEDFRSIGWSSYGYQWWLASEEERDYFGLGKDGQFLYVNPTRDTVIVRLGWSPGDLRSSQWISLFQSLSEAVE